MWFVPCSLSFTHSVFLADISAGGGVPQRLHVGAVGAGEAESVAHPAGSWRGCTGLQPGSGGLRNNTPHETQYTCRIDVIKLPCKICNGTHSPHLTRGVSVKYKCSHLASKELVQICWCDTPSLWLRLSWICLSVKSYLAKAFFSSFQNRIFRLDCFFSNFIRGGHRLIFLI